MKKTKKGIGYSVVETEPKTWTIELRTLKRRGCCAKDGGTGGGIGV